MTYSLDDFVHFESCVKSYLCEDVGLLQIEPTATCLLNVDFDILLVKLELPLFLFVFSSLLSEETLYEINQAFFALERDSFLDVLRI